MNDRRSILVTGAAGFIGYHLCRALIDRGEKVVGIDSLNDYYDVGLKRGRLAELGVDLAGIAADGSAVGGRGGFEFRHVALEGRVAIERLFADHRFDRVVNLAAQAGVRYSIENPRSYVDSNLVGFMNILEACRSARTPHLIYASSSSVYGLNARLPFGVHDGTDHPASLYAATKKANEMMAHAYAHLYGIPMTGLRFFTVYGPWGRPDMAYFKFALAMLRDQPIDVYAGGELRRDFTYIDDIVAGILAVLDRVPEPSAVWDPIAADPATSSAPYRIYNVGNNHPVKVIDFIAELERALGKKAKKRFLPMQAGDVEATEADITDLERDCGWKPEIDLAEGLDHFAAWFLPRYVGDSK
jgi:UDP-glucuronate 4-epimerase